MFLVSGLACYVCSRQQDALKKQAVIFSVLGGVLIGFSFLIRYTNVILVMPTLVLYELYTARLNIFTEKWRWTFFVMVGLFAVAVLWFNWVSLDGPFNSIYSTPALGAYPWPYFSLRYALGPSPVNGFSLKEALITLWRNFYLFLFLLPFGLKWCKREHLLLAGICVTTLGLYSIYAFAPKDENARFLLPMFPFLAVLLASTAVHLGQAYLLARWYKFVFAAALVLLAGSAFMQIGQLQARNQANDLAVEQVQQFTAQVPHDAVWLSNGLNDLIIVYGQQSALNYRRMIVANPDTGQFDMARYEGCLVETVDNLLAVNTPVYFIWDMGWNAADIMERHFQLAPVSFWDDTFEITAPLSADSRERLVLCQ